MAASPPARGRRESRHHQQQDRRQQRHGQADSAGEDGLSEEDEGLLDNDDAAGPPAAAAAGAGVDDAADGATTGGRSARAGRSLRDTVKKPPPAVSHTSSEGAQSGSGASSAWLCCSVSVGITACHLLSLQTAADEEPPSEACSLQMMKHTVVLHVPLRPAACIPCRMRSGLNENGGHFLRQTT